MFSPYFRVFLAGTLLWCIAAFGCAKTVAEVPNISQTTLILSNPDTGRQVAGIANVIGPDSLLICFARYNELPNVTCLNVVGKEKSGASRLAPYPTIVLKGERGS
jgi:hypothetical protein